MAQRRKPDFRPLCVVDSVRLSPGMHRLELVGDTLADFPAGIAGGYLKLAFDEQGQPVASGAKAAHLRTYTIRDVDPLARRVTIDFVLHGEGGLEDGPAAAFARRAQVGDRIGIAGPGSVKPLDPEADWSFIIGDMTALPAIAAKLEERQRHAAPLDGYLVLEVYNEDEAAYVEVPPGIALHTVVNPDPERERGALIDTVRGLPWLSGKAFVWCAAEFGRMKAVRDYVRGERSVGLDQRYISSYWMIGHTEEGHKVEKRRDADKDAV